MYKFLLVFPFLLIFSPSVGATPPSNGLDNRTLNLGTYSDAGFAIGSVLGTLTIGSSVIRRMIRL